LPDANRHAGEEFLDFELRGERVHARFASGREASADLLIGADGARSAVRAQLLPDRVPSYAGYVAWRGLVPEAQVPPAVAQRLGQAFAFQHGPRHQLLQYLVPGEDGSTEPGRRRRNWVWYRPVAPGDELARVLTDREGVRHAFSLPPGAPAPAVIDEMRQAAGQLLAPSFQHLVAATREPFLQAILDLRTPQMVFGRVLLLGDAAFVPRPHTAGGAAKAAADATALAVALRDGSGTLEQALAQWQRTQLTQGQALVDWGVTLGNRMMGLDETGRA
jgi:2-polyprenyl-6-methoxyphenol hydroxylase-like FAD-dependent oxidoreductase